MGGAGNDNLQGGDGNDTYRYNRGDGDDYIYDYRSTRSNRLEFGEGITVDDLLFSRVAADASDLRITFRDGSGSILIDHQNWSDAGIETFVFADGTTLTEAAANALIIPATNGNNVLDGTSSNDSIWVLEGDDTVSGLAGDDQLFGQDGADRLNGGDGQDSLSGGTGNDILAGGTGVDVLDGGTGNDTFRFLDGDSLLGDPADTIVGFGGGEATGSTFPPSTPN